tara:strand:+ start:1477 stop:1689 length:213 start_codon:yes stop_codon:yes gene_type:complete
MMQQLSSYHQRHISFRFSKYSSDNLEEYIAPNKLAQARIEHQFGYPIDVDKVWAARNEIYEREQNVLIKT